MTITEALAELKTLSKRVEKKRQFVRMHSARQNALRDPLAHDGGSREVLEREMQGIHDLEERIVRIRLAILRVNLDTSLTVGGESRTVQGWLTWRRDVANGQNQFWSTLSNEIQNVRKQAATKGWNVYEEEGDCGQMDVIVNVPEKRIHEKSEALATVLGELDGKLSLINATTEVAI